MKFFPATLVAFLLSTAVLPAQEPPLPSATETPAPSPNARPQLDIPEIPLTVEPTPLVPNTSATPKKPLPTIPELDAAFQHSSLGQEVEQQRLQVEWRKLKNRATVDPDVVAAKKAIESGRTDLEKRNLRRAYYKLYYTRMEAMADTAEMKAFLETKKQAIVASLAQPNVRPEPTAHPTAKP
jgi:hypothetical protein